MLKFVQKRKTTQSSVSFQYSIPLFVPTPIHRKPLAEHFSDNHLYNMQDLGSGMECTQI